MTARLIVAPAGAGKTRFAIQRIRDVLAAEPLAPVTVILPNDLRAAEFHRRVAGAGGTLGAEVVTFYSLYAEILAQAGQPRPRLLEPMQARLLREIVNRLWREGALQHYAALRAKPGFVAGLRATIEELKRARVEPDQFASAARGLGPSLDELAAAYAAYQDWLQREDWADREGQGWLAAIALEDHPALGTGTRLLVVNGFDEFNPTQLSVLAVLSRRASETLITLTGDLSRGSQDRPAHRRFTRAQHALTAALNLAPQPLEPAEQPRRLPAQLNQLEVGLFEGGSIAPRQPRHESGKGAGATPAVEFVEARDRATETRVALRWIKARIVRDRMAMSDVAVLARNLDPYRSHIEEIADEFGLPVHLTGGLPLASNPAVAALLSALSLPALDWPRRQVLEAWHSPYLDWSQAGIAPADAAALDNVSRLGHVQAGLGQWREALDLAARPTYADDDQDEMPDLPDVDADALRARFEAFVARLVPAARGTARDYAAFVEDLIGDDLAYAPRGHARDWDAASLNVVRRARETAATAERDAAALRSFKDVLRGLVLAESATPSQADSPEMDYPAFYAELRGAVQAADYTAWTPSEPGVLVASMLDARGVSLRAAVLIGLSEGECPQPEREDVFLRERDRRELRARGLPIEPKLRGDEMTFFYQAVTRAGERLLLTRPYLAGDGQPWEPSPYWQEVQRILGSPRPHRARPEDALDAAGAASAVEWMRISRRFDPPLARDVAMLRARFDRAAHSAFDGDLSALSPELSERYRPSYTWSASRLEAYGACPFYFYIAYALELEPRTPPEEGYDARILGSMLHRILELTYRRAADPSDVNACLCAMEAVAGEVMAGAPGVYGFRPSPLWPRQQGELRDSLRQTITALSEASHGYTPRHFEAQFGIGQPPLVLSTAVGEVRLRGYIDRIDAGPDGRLRVIDYKSSGTPIGRQDLAEGRRLQLPLYALAARHALNLGEIEGGFYWHIHRAEASALKLETYDGGVEGAFTDVVRHVAGHIGGIRGGCFQPQPPTGGCPSYCPATAFCWRYAPREF